MSPAVLIRSTNGHVRRVLILTLATLLLFTVLAVVPGATGAEAADPSPGYTETTSTMLKEHAVWDPAPPSPPAKWVLGHPKGYTEGETASFRVTFETGAADPTQLWLDVCLDYDVSSNGSYAFLDAEPWDTSWANWTNPTPPPGGPFTAELNGFKGQGLTVNTADYLGIGLGNCAPNYLSYRVEFTTVGAGTHYLVYGGHLAEPGGSLVGGGEVPVGQSASFVNGTFQARVEGGGDKTVNFSGNDIIPLETTLKLVKTVTTDNGGTAVPDDWTLAASAGGSLDFSNAGGSGVFNIVCPETGYVLSETGGPAGYDTGEWECDGGSLVGSELTLAEGDSVTCTINNDDIAPTLILEKFVINDDGGTLTESDFPAFIDTTSVAWLAVTSLSAGTYTASETEQPGYMASDWGGDCAADGTVTLALGETKVCTITNDDIAPTLTLEKTVINDDGGTLTEASFPAFIDGNSVMWDAVNTLSAGTFVASETEQDGYTASVWGGGCDANGSVTLALGEDKVCTITNDDDGLGLTLIKQVINDDGGTALPSAWTLTADGPTTFSGAGPTVSSPSPFLPGTYSLSESTVAGYAVGTDWVCTGDGQFDSTGNRIILGLGDSATCTIVNDDVAPTLKLVKTVVNAEGGIANADDWTLAATAGGTRDFETKGGSGVFETVYANAGYVLSETAVPGYTAGSWSCNGGKLVGSTVTLDEGETGVTCTIVNDDVAPTLKLVKTIVNGDNGTAVADDWTLAATAGGTRDFDTKGGSGVFETVYANAGYVLSEIGPAGYTAGAWSCDGGSLVGSTITLGIDTDVTCTVVNTKLSAITIVKVSIAGTDTFDFMSTALGDFSLTTVVDGTDATAKVNFIDLAAGTYDVAEVASDDWYLAEATCDDGSDPASIALGIGEHVTCTFTNGQVLGTAQLGDTVWLDKDKDGAQDADEPGINGAKVILKDADGNVIATRTTFKGAWDGFYKFLALDAGTYTAVLDMTSVTGELTTAGAFTINLADGDDYTKADFGVAEVLPKTGMDAAALVLLGLALLAAGAVAVLFGRRRGENT